ncbi:15695_t:CDS:2 [Entrophospora sp. SA101]|nr:15695_t:CDS:2 [Entrophospora sp. SA101]
MYNDTITIKHKGTSAFLHSHTECYPLHYGGGCVSSKGQQMTGYPHNDTNNHWQIKIPGSLFDSSRPENQTW